MSKPSNLEIYNKIKEELFRKYPKPSAYRSGMLVSEYKKYMESKGLKPYIGEYKKSSNLARWFREVWTSDDGTVGYKHKNSVYRPTIRINEKTPITFSELTKEELERAKRKKAREGRIDRFRKE
jgi:hypothetical protein